MILCITEKPSVARDIAAILGADHSHQGFIEGNGYCITWTFGHLCTLKEPADYSPNWKRWSLSALPMIPERFGIKLIDKDSIKKQFKVIADLSSKADEIINCGDAGQEGELIQRWVMQKARVKCPVKRLWISSLTDESIREGFKNLRPQSEFDNLYMAGLSRAVGDWVLGMNATRLFSLKYSVPGKVLSIGRVQTPTLAIVVERQHEIDNFVAKPYWELTTEYRGVTFNGVDLRFDEMSKAETVLSLITGRPLRVDSVEKKKGKEAPPRLFDLTSLQVECNKRWGWSADTSLKLIQTLYEKKVTTYPRVDTTYLTDDLYPKIPTILQNMTPYAAITAPLLAGKLPKTKKVFDNTKVTDHHAIIPTGQSPTSLSGDEKKMYHIIALRFIAAFYPDCQFTSTVVGASVDDFKFKATGKAIDSPGWKALYAKDKTDNNEPTDTLPVFTVGESGPHTPQVVERTTQPPKYFTEGTLLRAMETAGRNIEDEELREAMKENGIGRPSTRAAIIEILLSRGYISREKKSLRATEAGIALIGLIKADIVKSPRLTGIWENRLRRIERGTYQASEFAAKTREMVQNIVIDVLSDNVSTKIYDKVDDVVPEKKKKSRTTRKSKSTATTKTTRKSIRRMEDIKCPVCGEGHIVKGHTAYGCSRYKDGCHTLLPFTEYDSTLTPARLYSKIKPLYEKH